MAKVSCEREFNAPKRAVFEAITDFPSYPDFIPEVVTAKVRQAKKDIVVVDFELEVMKRFQYTLEFHLSDESKVEWKLKESNFFKKNEGSWQLFPSAPGKTQVFYELDIAMGFFVPNWVTKKLTEVNLPQMLDQFDRRAQKKAQ